MIRSTAPVRIIRTYIFPMSLARLQQMGDALPVATKSVASPILQLCAPHSPAPAYPCLPRQTDVHAHKLIFFFLYEAPARIVLHVMGVRRTFLWQSS